jgi:hypothetical protein
MDTPKGILYRLFISRFLLVLLCFFCVGDIAWCQETALT